GVQNANPEQQLAATAAGFGTLAAPATGRRSGVAVPVSSSRAANGAAARTKSLLLTEPVRSGTQIYAPGGDVIVVRSVSAGAEVIADGHIHVYGTLRGRAVA